MIGATLDRNGLRPGRWMETRDGWVVLASESGVLDEPPGNVLRKGRLQPGKLFLVDLDEGRIVADEEVKERVATAKPVRRVVRARASCGCEDLPERQGRVHREPLRTRQLAFGYTQEDLRVLLAPMAAKGEEPIGSMGNDLALAVLSDQAPPLFSYFKQLFAQVTNPPIDPIRESVVMSIRTGVGSEANLLTEGPDHAHQLVIPHPILRNAELEALRGVDSSVFRSHTIPITWRGRRRAGGHDVGGAADLRAGGRGDRLRRERPRAVRPRRRRASAPRSRRCSRSPPCTTTSCARARACRPACVLESGEPREVHHFATLIGYGASAINPYLMLESLAEVAAPRSARAGRAQRRQGDRQGPAQDALEDGHLDDPVLQRRADLRGRRARRRS